MATPGGDTGGGTIGPELTPDFDRIRTGDVPAVYTAFQTIWKILHELILRPLTRLTREVDLHATVVPFAAANYTASAGAWTVALADHIDVRYHLVGNWMTVSFAIANTNVGPGPAVLRMAVPGGYTVKSVNAQNPIRVQNAGVFGIGIAVATAAIPFISFYADAAGANFGFTIGNDTNVVGHIHIEVERGG